MAKGYWIVRITVTDPDLYPSYVQAASSVYAQYGGRMLVRGGQYEAAEGEARPRNVVVEFPSFQAALDCYHSDTYQAAKAIRNAASDAEFLIIEGHEG